MNVVYFIVQDAPYIILLEDDLQVSPDFYRLLYAIFVMTIAVTFVFSFFSQTEYLMREDDSLFCISAWNDFVSSPCKMM